MVLTLPIPGAGKTTSSGSKWSSSSTSLSLETDRVQDTKLPAVTSTGRLETTTKATSSASSSALASYASLPTTLGETLLGTKKPFGGASGHSRPNKVLPWLARETDEETRERQELNDGIVVLARLFPDVKIEVFRELLERFDGDSRLRVCVEQLLRYPAQYIRGRWRTRDTVGDSETGKIDDGGDSRARNADPIPVEELFRGKEYKAAVKMMLAQEFPSLNDEAIDKALAEVNYCYTRARPTVRELSGNSWRSTVGTFLRLRRKKRRSCGAPPSFIWEDGEDTSSMRETGCAELDKEIYESFVAPGVAQRLQEQVMGDRKMAEELNGIEARDADALYECCCCVADVAFEQIATCSTSSHFVCFTCIQRTMHQAVFGQGWAKSIDSSKATLQCLAPLPKGSCDGVLDCHIVERAVLAGKAGSEVYRKFEDRLAEQNLLNSQLKLVRCPFCSYAEVDPVFHPSPRGIVWQFRRDNLMHTIPLAIFLFDFAPLLACLSLVCLLFFATSLTAVVSTSLRNLSLRKRSRRFVCSNPSCRRQSCLTCQKAWKDPHACHEKLFLSLHDVIEAARTAAVKRTCPRCNLSFVRDAGCNKMICPCGFSMCYVCRKALGPKPLSDRTRQYILAAEPANGPYARGALLEGQQPLDVGEAEGYRHFCPHFRPNGEYSCPKCTKCHLYAVENDETLARRAAEKAEREWRIRQGLVGSAMPLELELKRSHLPGNVAPRRRSKGRQLSGLFGANWDLSATVRFLTQDLWRDDRWKEVGQNFVDRLIETVVVVVDV